jgi:hypothetical protein
MYSTYASILHKIQNISMNVILGFRVSIDKVVLSDKPVFMSLQTK